MKKLAIAALAATLLLGVGGANATDEKFITIGAGGQTSVYYVVGQSICRLVNRSEGEHGIRCTAPATGGSVANLNAIRAGEQDLGVVQSDPQYKAMKGQESFEAAGPNEALRAVFSVHPESFTVMARQDAGIKTFDDLKGKRVNIGNPGSQQRVIMDMLMREKGWETSIFRLVSELPASEQARALCNNDIDAMLYVVSHPNGSILEAAYSCNGVLVPVTGPEVGKLVAEFPYYATSVIPGGMYPGNAEEVPTFGVAATVVSSTQVSDDVVYEVVKAVFENFDRFKTLHPAFETLDPARMIEAGLSAPLHNGAITYYQEKGFNIPRRLVPPEYRVAGDVTAGRAKSATCAACHNADGNSTFPQYPKLAGQGAEYLFKQLWDYRNGVRINAVMLGMSAALSEQDMWDLAAFYASQPVTRGVVDPELAPLGEAIFLSGNSNSGVPACVVCHGLTGAGNPVARFPALAGQHAQYIEGQLQAFRSTERANDVGQVMRNIAAGMTDEEIMAVSAYLQGLDVSSDPDFLIAVTTLITHYYQSILERAPEPAGLAFWQKLVIERQTQGVDVKPVFRDMANFFFNSQEYLDRNTTDHQFITNLYLTFFQRSPDDGGYAFWLDQLAGGVSRNHAMNGFLHSPEFTAFMERVLSGNNRLGLTVTEVPADQGGEGVLVRDVTNDGPASRAGIRAGDVIARVNNVNVTEVSQFESLVKELPTGRPIPVLVRRDRGALFLALTIPK